MALVAIDHIEKAITRLASQYKGKTNIDLLMSACFAEANRIEDTLQQVLEQQSIAGAVGDQLDVIGRIVKQEREGASDADYRIRIRARVLVNRSSGTVNELITIFELLITDSTLAGATVRVEDLPPASIRVTVGGIVLTDEQVTRLSNILKLARAAGIGARFVHLIVPPADTFTLDGVNGQGLDEGAFASVMIA